MKYQMFMRTRKLDPTSKGRLHGTKTNLDFQREKQEDDALRSDPFSTGLPTSDYRARARRAA